jgi:serine/threonine protein kinase/WD40 repeat protein
VTDEHLETVERLFHAALELEPAERAAFVTDACGDDDALRDEVASLLSSAETAEPFLERPALMQAADLPVAPEPPPEIPGYTVLSLLGEGGMGVVYLAEQMTPIRRRVAVKLIKLGMDTRQVLSRFGRERQALALMRHPNIAAVYDAGTSPGGRPYFVMEYVDGVPVTEYCDQHALSIGDRLALFLDVCSAVQHAHQKGVIHRDLKPSNVLVADVDGRRQPKVIDFGVAKAIEPSSSARTAFTEHGLIVGTLEYMSPEQANLSADIDTTTDVYSLGVLLYELLVGALPFDTARLREAGYDEMRRVIRETDPPRPSVRLATKGGEDGPVPTARRTELARLARALRGDLDWVVLRAIEKERRRRYPTVSALAADLGRYLAHEPVTARPLSAVYRMRKFTRRYRVGVSAGVAALVALVAGLTAAFLQYRVAVAARAEAQDSAYAATIAAADAELRLSLGPEARRRLLQLSEEQRGWEWHHLFLRTDTSLETITADVPLAPCDGSDPATPPSPMSDDALSLDEAGDRVRLRRCGHLVTWTGAERRQTTMEWPGRVLAVNATEAAVVLSPEGTGGPRSWYLLRVSIATGQPTGRLGPFGAEPICAGFGADRIAVGLLPTRNRIGLFEDDIFEVWDLTSARQLVRIAPPRPPADDTRRPRPATCMVAFSPDATKLATSGATINVWDLPSAAELLADAGQAGRVAQPVAWSPDGGSLAVGRLTGFVEILDLERARRGLRATVSGTAGAGLLFIGDRRMAVAANQRAEVLTVAFSPDGARVVAGRDVTVTVWDADRAVETDRLVGHDAPVVGVAIDAVGRIFSSDMSGQVKVWQTGAQGVKAVKGSHTPRDVAVSADGSAAVMTEMDAGASLWRFAERRWQVLRPGKGNVDLPHIIRGLAIGPDARRVYGGESDNAGSLRIWDTESGTSDVVPLNATWQPGCEPLRPERDIQPVENLALNRDGRYLAYGQGQCVVVLDLVTRGVVATYHAYSRSFAFLPDDTLVMTSYLWVPQPSGGPGSARVIRWNWRAGVVAADVATPSTPTDFENGSWEVDASADGAVIALTGGGGRSPAVVLILDAQLRGERERLPVPPDTDRVALSADGQRLASAGRDGSLRIWDVARRRLMLLLPERGPFVSLAFTRDGRLVAARASGGLFIWEVARAVPTTR